MPVHDNFTPPPPNISLDFPDNFPVPIYTSGWSGTVRIKCLTKNTTEWPDQVSIVELTKWLYLDENLAKGNIYPPEKTPTFCS